MLTSLFAVSLLRKLGTVIQFVVKNVFPEVSENGKSSETTTDNGVQEAAKNDYSKKLSMFVSEFNFVKCFSLGIDRDYNKTRYCYNKIS